MDIQKMLHKLRKRYPLQVFDRVYIKTWKELKDEYPDHLRVNESTGQAYFDFDDCKATQESCRYSKEETYILEVNFDPDDGTVEYEVGYIDDCDDLEETDHCSYWSKEMFYVPEVKEPKQKKKKKFKKRLGQAPGEFEDGKEAI